MIETMEQYEQWAKEEERLPERDFQEELTHLVLESNDDGVKRVLVILRQNLLDEAIGITLTSVKRTLDKIMGDNASETLRDYCLKEIRKLRRTSFIEYCDSFCKRPNNMPISKATELLKDIITSECKDYPGKNVFMAIVSYLIEQLDRGAMDSTENNDLIDDLKLALEQMSKLSVTAGGHELLIDNTQKILKLLISSGSHEMIDALLNEVLHGKYAISEYYWPKLFDFDGGSCMKLAIDTKNDAVINKIAKMFADTEDSTIIAKEVAPYLQSIPDKDLQGEIGSSLANLMKERLEVFQNKITNNRVTEQIDAKIGKNDTAIAKITIMFEYITSLNGCLPSKVGDKTFAWSDNLYNRAKDWAGKVLYAVTEMGKELGDLAIFDDFCKDVSMVFGLNQLKDKANIALDTNATVSWLKSRDDKKVKNKRSVQTKARGGGDNLSLH